MFLLVCALDKEIIKYELSELIHHNPQVENAIWLSGENAKEVEMNEVGFSIGSISSLFKNKEQNVLLAKIRGRENLENIIELIKAYKNNVCKLDYFVVQLVA